MNTKIYKIPIIFLSLLILAPFVVFAQLPNPLGGAGWADLINRIAGYIFKLAIPVSVIVIIWSGIVFMSAGGNEQRITNAKKTLFWAIVGLAVCLIGLGFVSLIKDILGARQ